MKKVKIEKKLSLNKETVAKLNKNEMTQVNGGGFTAFLSIYKSCVNVACLSCKTCVNCDANA